MTDLDDWQARVDAFWADFDDSDPDGCLARMRALVEERPPGDPFALAEWGGVHDSLGLEAEAVEPYRRALAAGLPPEKAHQVTIQLASTLRNLGRYDEALALLGELDAPELGDAPAFFRALVLHSAGRPAEALSVALTALAEHLPRYTRSARAYAADLVE
ncbi:tetratricopeptide repeat protein [Gryllotalpicola ginsengisoli]|uniref:tetratricopeptide repeat protein n=1 Tax=Gryllotalpicola ginsengisoli TaxID=444608 RepID=UPI0003B52200|nr:tetratricopeptide repeat protein [Gryllotalpicola ginsengisoli]